MVPKKEEKQEVKLHSLETEFELLKQQELEWKLIAKQSKEEADEKVEIVEALKKKIAELVVNLQEERREKTQEQERCKLIKSNFEELSRNLEWHKKQLHECQVARDRAYKDLDEERQRSAKPSGKLMTDVDHGESHLSLPTVKEFSNISHSIEITAADGVASVLQDGLDERQRWAREEKIHWEAIVAELEGQVELWKKETEVLSDVVLQSEKERVSWLGRVAELQTLLEEGVSELEGCRGKLKEAECRFAEEEERRRIAEGEREEIRAALNGARKEKEALDGAVECIRNDFDRVRKSFELMKSLLTQKDKELADMRSAALSKNESQAGGTQPIIIHLGKSLDVEDLSALKNGGPQDSCINLGVPAELSPIQSTKGFNNNDCDMAEERVDECSGSSMVGASPCCLAAMESVDLDWRQKHRVSVRALIKKLSQKQKLIESKNLLGDILDTAKCSGMPLSKTLPPFSALPIPPKFNDSVILQLISKGKEIIEGGSNCSVASLKSSLTSLEEEVTNLENKMKLTFSMEPKMRELQATDISNV